MWVRRLYSTCTQLCKSVAMWKCSLFIEFTPHAHAHIHTHRHGRAQIHWQCQCNWASVHMSRKCSHVLAFRMWFSNAYCVECVRIQREYALSLCKYWLLVIFQFNQTATDPILLLLFCECSVRPAAVDFAHISSIVPRNYTIWSGFSHPHKQNQYVCTQTNTRNPIKYRNASPVRVQTDLLTKIFYSRR